MHIHEEDLDLYICGGTPPALELAVEQHLPECVQCQTIFAEALVFRRKLAQITKPTPRRDWSRRKEIRIPTDEPAAMRRLNPFSAGCCDIRIVDISASGFKLLVPMNLAVGAVVQVRFKDQLVVGEVRYCFSQDGRYQAGMQIYDAFRSIQSAS